MVRVGVRVFSRGRKPGQGGVGLEWGGGLDGGLTAHILFLFLFGFRVIVRWGVGVGVGVVTGAITPTYLG